MTETADMSLGGERPLLNYISNLPRDQNRGGWDGINTAIAAGLERYFRLNYGGPVHPRIPAVRRGLTLLRRIARRPEHFESFSANMLREYALGAERLSDRGAVADFFHGATPWVQTKPARPYFAYVDASFATYVSLYHKNRKYSDADLDRTISLERKWMSRATQIFFSSRWAASAAVDEFGYDGTNFTIAGVGGAVDPPDSDFYTGGVHFLAVVTDFERKGGRISADAFRIVRNARADATLTFIGVEPPASILEQRGINYAGYLDKNVPAQLERLRALYASATAALLPTSAETTPVLIAELGYFGCPTIAPSLYGIREMVIDGETGILLREKVDAESLANAMFDILASDQYPRMRAAARAFTTSRLNWENVVNKIALTINETRFGERRPDQARISALIE